MINNRPREWIHVDQRLPKPLDDVLVACPGDDGKWAVDLGFMKLNRRFFLTGTILEVDVTYWMQLPRPPIASPEEKEA